MRPEKRGPEALAGALGAVVHWTADAVTMPAPPACVNAGMGGAAWAT